MIQAWSAEEVGDWLTAKGFSDLVSNFIENDITGDILIHADHDLLKELEIDSVGSRIAILKLIYQEKLDRGIPLDEDDYIPETAVIKASNLNDASSKYVEGWALNKRKSHIAANEYLKFETSLEEKDEAINRLTSEVKKLSHELAQLKEDLIPVWYLVKEYKNFQIKSEMRKKNVSSEGKLKSPKTSASGSSSMMKGPSSANSSSKSPSLQKSNIGSSGTSIKKGLPKVSGLDISSQKASTSDLQVPSPSTAVLSPNGDDINPTVGTIKIYVDKNLKRESESYKSFKVSVYDPCSRILPVALKKYKLEENWQNYALFIQARGTERCLNFDEKPLDLLLKVKETTSEVPVFILKHLKQIKKVERNSGPLESTYDLKRSASQNFKLFGGSKKAGTLAVAVYEYKAERDDEIDVAIGDTFKIVKTESGWCVVEKEGHQYWVPASCLIENEEKDVGDANYLSSGGLNASMKGSNGGSSHQTTGVAIYDYKKISPNEMSIKTGDVLRIHKKYNHWLLAECNDQRGWVPSCYVSINGENS